MQHTRTTLPQGCEIAPLSRNETKLGNNLCRGYREKPVSNSSQWVLRDRLAGGLVGLLVGDALGVPYEFHSPSDLPPPDLIEFTPPKGFRRSHVGVPPGTWSDDGAHALVLLDSLLARNGLDLAHLGDGIRRWLHEGRYAVGGMVFDIGIQTSSAINNLVQGMPAERSGPAEEARNGNGSLMRVLPLALWHSGDEAELIQLAARQSLPTHGHARSQVACAIYCLWARAVMNGASDPWALAEHQLRTQSPAGLFPHQELELVLNPAHAATTNGTGYVVDCLWSARQALDETDSYETCVKRAIAFGHDTDTTAAVAGGIAGLCYGLQGIPQRWRLELRGENLYRPLLDRLLDHHQPFKPVRGPSRTSASHPLQVATLPAGAGRIGVTLCPGKKQADALTGAWDRDLDTDLLSLKQWGTKHLVTLIEENELVQLQVEDLPERAALMGLRWHHLPIVDGQAPDRHFERLWQAVAPQLIRSLNDGAGVVVHCKGGLGRAGTVAARLLMHLDETMTPAEAISKVRSVRTNAIETRVQECYLLGLKDPD